MVVDTEAVARQPRLDAARRARDDVPGVLYWSGGRRESALTTMLTIRRFSEAYDPTVEELDRMRPCVGRLSTCVGFCTRTDHSLTRMQALGRWAAGYARYLDTGGDDTFDTCSRVTRGTTRHSFRVRGGRPPELRVLDREFAAPIRAAREARTGEDADQVA